MIEDPGATSPQVIVFNDVCPVESLKIAMLPIAVTDPVELMVFEKVTAANTQVAKSKKHKPTIAIAVKSALDLYSYRKENQERIEATLESQRDAKAHSDLTQIAMNELKKLKELFDMEASQKKSLNRKRRP